MASSGVGLPPPGGGGYKIEPEREQHYQVKGPKGREKLYVGDKAVVVKRDGVPIKNVDQLRQLAETMNETLEAKKIHKGQVWNISADKVSVCKRQKDGTLVKVSKSIVSSEQKTIKFLKDDAGSRAESQGKFATGMNDFTKSLEPPPAAAAATAAPASPTSVSPSSPDPSAPPPAPPLGGGPAATSTTPDPAMPATMPPLPAPPSSPPPSVAPSSTSSALPPPPTLPPTAPRAAPVSLPPPPAGQPAAPPPSTSSTSGPSPSLPTPPPGSLASSSKPASPPPSPSAPAVVHSEPSEPRVELRPRSGKRKPIPDFTPPPAAPTPAPSFMGTTTSTDKVGQKLTGTTPEVKPPTSARKREAIVLDEEPEPTAPAGSTPSTAVLSTKQTLSVPIPEGVKARFEKVGSGHIEAIPLAGDQNLREMADPRTDCFLQVEPGNPHVVPPVTIRSSFISEELGRHLIEDKVDLAMHDKSAELKWGEKKPITNVEAIYAQLQVQLIAAHATGDIIFQKDYSRFENNLGRPVIVSTNIHPDYERGDPEGKVMALLTEVTDQPKPKVNEDDLRYDSDKGLLDALVHHHTAAGLPSRAQIEADKGKTYTVMDQSQAKKVIEEMITSPGADAGAKLQNKFVKLANGEIHSLEALYNHYLFQLENELTGLESTLSQGYVYTIDPPSIFATNFDGALMTRLQILALKQLESKADLKNLKKIAFNDFGPAGKGAVKLLQSVFGERAVAKKPGLYSAGPPPEYTIKENWALVIHNNSDAFGNNLVNEGKGGMYGSLDAVVGGLTTAGVAVRPGEPERLTHCYSPPKKGA